MASDKHGTDNRDAALARTLLKSIARQRREQRRWAGTLSPAPAAPVSAAGDEGWELPTPPKSVEDEGPGTTPELEGVEPEPRQGVYRLGPTLRLGLNQTKCYVFREPEGEEATLTHDEDRYGSAFTAALADCASLGVNVIRQPGDADLTWPSMSVDIATMSLADQGLGADVPTLDTLRPGGTDIDIDAVVDAETIERLTTLLSTAFEHGIKVIFTFLHYGNGGIQITDSYPSDTLAGSTDAPSDVVGTNLTHVKLSWSADHQGEQIQDDELYAVDPTAVYDFPTDVARSDSDPHLHYQILDPWCPYMHIMVRHLAELAGRVLLRVHDELVAANVSGYTGLADVVEGIELLNELDHDCTPDRSSVYGTGQAWGRLCYHAARGLRAAGLDEDVRILLPGLSSWKGSMSTPDEDEGWTQRLEFVEGLVNGFGTEFQTRATDLEESTSISNLETLMQGMDLHWYHFRESDPPLHAGFLHHEVEELRDAIEAGLTDLGATKTEAEPFRSMPITVFESSTATFDPGSGSPTYVPSFSPYSHIDTQTYQALEVWRRLVAGFCGGLETSGWHAWMAGEAGAFVGTGLRGDEPEVTGGPGDAKPGWYAYQAVAWVLQGVVSGSVVFPATSSRGDLVSYVEAAKAGTSDPTAPFVIFELRLSAFRSPFASVPTGTEPRYDRMSWAYVVMFDPTIDQSSITADGEVEGDDAFDFGGTVAFRIESTGVEGTAFTGDDPSTWLAMSTPITVARSDLLENPEPRVFLSTRRLSWSIGIKLKDVPFVPAWVLDRPAWWDGVPEGL